MAKKYWLMKSEPGAYSIDHLERDGKTCWDGVRNYQARNFMRDEMNTGDRVFFYHSNTEVPGIVGLAKIASAPYPDPEALNPASRYYDPKSTPDDPRWFLVDIRLVRKFDCPIPLRSIKSHALTLGDFPLVRKGNRLSVMPVNADQWDFILSLQAA